MKMYNTRKIGLFAGLVAVVALAACNDKKEDETNTVNKAGAVETSVTVQHVDSTHDVVLTSHKIWVNFSEYKTVVHQDTVPALGIVETEGENTDGDTKKVKVPKDYEIYITVK